MHECQAIKFQSTLKNNTDNTYNIIQHNLSKYPDLLLELSKKFQKLTWGKINSLKYWINGIVDLQFFFYFFQTI